MRDVLLDKVMYVVFLPPQPPAPLHKAVLRGCSSDLWPQHETARPFMSLRTASIYQTSAGSFDLRRHVTWSYLSEVDFGFIVANMACVNLHVGVCKVKFVFFFFIGQHACHFPLAPDLCSSQELLHWSKIKWKNLIYSASTSFIFKAKGSFNSVSQSVSSKIWPIRIFLLKADISADLQPWPC